MRHRQTAMVECSTDLPKILYLATDVQYNGIESEVTRFIFRQSSGKVYIQFVTQYVLIVSPLSLES